MGKKFYAVRAGHVPGVYDTYEDAKQQVDGFSSAEWKGFNVREKAVEFLRGSNGQSGSGNGQNGSTNGQFQSPLPDFGELSLNPSTSRFATLKSTVRSRQDQLERTKALLEEQRRLLTREKMELLALDKERARAKNQDGYYHVWLDMVFENFEAAYMQSQFDFDGIVSVNNLVDAFSEVRETGFPEMHEMFEDFFATCDYNGFAVSKVYVDGVCCKNSCGEAEAGIGVCFGPSHRRNIAEPLFTLDGPPTSQAAELTALKRAYHTILEHHEENVIYHVFTASSYVIDCVTKWCLNSEEKGWVSNSGKPVVNMDLIKDILKLKAKLGARVVLKKVNSRRELGSEQAEELANLGITRGRYLVEEEDDE